MNDPFLVEELQTLQKRQESVYDFGLFKINHVMSSSTILKLSLESRDTPRIEKTIVVDDRSDQVWMNNMLLEGHVGGWLQVVVGSFGGFVK